MKLSAEKELAHIGETHAMDNHDRDLVHELSKRLDACWRYDQYIANAEDGEELRDFWRDLKEQDIGVVQRLKGLIRAEIDKNCF